MTQPAALNAGREIHFVTRENLVALLLPNTSSLVARIVVSVTISTIKGRSTLYIKWPLWL